MRELGRKEQVLGSEKTSRTTWRSFAERLQSGDDAVRVEHVLTSVVFGGDCAVTPWPQLVVNGKGAQQGQTYQRRN